MTGPNLVSGARIRVGSAATAGSATQPSRFATRGTETAVLVSSPNSTWSGTAVCLGSPPVVIADDGVRLLLIGEIYNGERVSAELAGGAAHDCDAALVLAAWRHWGRAAFRVLNGRYAVVLQDDRAGVVVVVADHAGSVPLWVRADEHGIDISTELKLLSGVTGPWAPIAGGECLPGVSGTHRVPAATALVLRGVGTGRPASAPLRTWLPPR
jgi:(carboxyethyl)arginine beta-lactam-synthase